MTDGQKRLEEHMTRTLYENNVNQKDLINGMMRAEAAGCSYEEGTLSFAFPVQKWQTNRVGSLHGGIIATAFDLTVAALARHYAGANFAPTVSLDIKYVRPPKRGRKTPEYGMRHCRVGRQAHIAVSLYASGR